MQAGDEHATDAGFTHRYRVRSGCMISAAILAGGRAVDSADATKASLSIDGRTILDRQIGELSQVADGILRGRRRRAAERRPCRGRPGAGLRTARRPRRGADRARGDVTLVVGCDMPFVTAVSGRTCLALPATPTPSCRGPNADIIRCAPRTRVDAWSPSRGGWRTAPEDDRPVRRRAGACGDVEEVAVFGDPGQLLANVNTPADYDRIEALHSHEL